MATDNQWNGLPYLRQSGRPRKNRPLPALFDRTHPGMAVERVRRQPSTPPACRNKSISRPNPRRRAGIPLHRALTSPALPIRRNGSVHCWIAHDGPSEISPWEFTDRALNRLRPTPNRRLDAITFNLLPVTPPTSGPYRMPTKTFVRDILSHVVHGRGAKL